jgi:uncharacterized protein (TIGR03437 family)
MGRRRGASIGLVLSIAGILVAQNTAVGVGDGAPTSELLAQFIQAFFRSGFSARVLSPPRDNVHRVGSGYVQDFNPASGTDNYALVKPDSAGQALQMCCTVLQVQTSLGGFTAAIGYPTSDPTPMQSPVDGSAGTQQNFEGGYTIVSYESGPSIGTGFYIREPYLTRWKATSSLAFPVSLEHATTSRFSSAATQQDFQGGIIFQMTSGARQNSLFSVAGPIYVAYAAAGGAASYLGYPIGDEFTFSGKQRQNFEGGLIEDAPGQPAVARAPVASVSLPTAALNLQVGNVVQLNVGVYDVLGNPVTDRPVTWSTSNSAVVQIVPSGTSAAVRAVGTGFANVTALVDGVASPVLRLTVTSVCCLVGEGAPTAVVRQAIQDALARNGIDPRLPTDNPVRRTGAGYTQEFSALQPVALGRFLVAKSDAAAQAFVVSGERLALYQQLGGVAGPLGFAASDANAAGRQLFENHGAIAGSPALPVQGTIFDKWAAIGYEAGAAGLPVAAAAATAWTPFASLGVGQSFSGGVIYAYTAGARPGQAFFTTGLILARYQSLGSPAGAFGLPTSDAFPSEGRTRQNFEGGWIDFAAGDAAATEHLAPRTPAVTVVPAQTAAGGRVRVAASGFTAGRRLHVTLTGQPDFDVTVPAGTFGWDVQILSSAPAGVYRVTVRDPASGEQADTSYQVRTTSQVKYQLTKVSGDNQSALPGSTAALPLVVRLTDDSGSPVAGVQVSFNTLAGGTITPLAASTDLGGYAQASWRLPPAAGLTLATAEARGQVATFAARGLDGTLTSFPAFRQAIDNLNVGSGADSIHKKGSLLTALAALFRYYQDQGQLPAATGLADPVTLNQFLNQFLTGGGYLPFQLNGRSEQVLNVVRALAFVSDAADIEVLPNLLDSIRDSLNQRSPVIVGLMLRSGDQNRGAHYVVATGIGPDGTILVQDPSPDWNRTTLGDYLNGFSALGRNWSATLLHAFRLSLAPRSPRGFVTDAPGAAGIHVTAPAGRGYLLRIPALAAFDELATDSGDTADLWYSDGMASQYQLNAAAGGAEVRGPRVIGPLGAGAYRIDPSPDSFAVTTQTLTATADGLRHAASFGPRLAPGSLASLFGSGLADGLAIPLRLPLPASLGGLRVTVGGLTAPLLFVLPYQANLQLPFGLAPGTQPVEVTSLYGSVRFEVTLDAAAPGIFLLGPSSGAVLNQDGVLNSAVQPAARGSVLQVFATGFGEVAPAVGTGAQVPLSPLSRTVATVSATLDGQPAPVQFAGLAPGFAGLYQINVQVPAALAPHAAAQLVIRAGGLESNAAPVAVQ